MPDTDETPVPSGELEVSPAPPPAPTFVTAEEFRTSQAQVNQTLAALNETMQRLAEGARSPAPQYVPPSPAPARITRAQFIEAVQQGDERMIEAYEDQQKQALLAEHVHPLRDNGLEAIANLTRTTTVGSLPYYQRWKKEIEQFIAALPAGMRMNPEVYQTAHEVVVGRHTAELIAEAREAALRGPAPDAEPPSETGRGRGERPRTGVPTPFDLGGQDAVEAIVGAGKDQDQMAQRMGYANWKDYMDKTAEYRVAR